MGFSLIKWLLEAMDNRKFKYGKKQVYKACVLAKLLKFFKECFGRYLIIFILMILKKETVIPLLVFFSSSFQA